VTGLPDFDFEPSVWTLKLPYDRPPLTANQRGHWGTHDNARKTLILAVQYLAMQQHMHTMTRCSVSLHWAPPDRRRRDADNLWPTQKVACDALVRLGVIRDDTPDLMVKPCPVIEPPQKPPRLWLVVTDLSTPPSATLDSKG
jgi:crossover junction endodeoxyribonuclease RusA